VPFIGFFRAFLAFGTYSLAVPVRFQRISRNIRAWLLGILFNRVIFPFYAVLLFIVVVFPSVCYFLNFIDIFSCSAQGFCNLHLRLLDLSCLDV
jgi:hypothetical protein